MTNTYEHILFNAMSDPYFSGLADFNNAHSREQVKIAFQMALFAKACRAEDLYDFLNCPELVRTNIPWASIAPAVPIKLGMKVLLWDGKICTPVPSAAGGFIFREFPNDSAGVLIGDGFVPASIGGVNVRAIYSPPKS